MLQECRFYLTISHALSAQLKLACNGPSNYRLMSTFLSRLIVVYVFYFCLSNAMHGQNINLPVCVSVTLSVNSPTGQTPQRIFTVDSLKDVHFGGLDDE